MAAAAAAAQEARCRQQEQGRGQQEQKSKASKDAHNLSPVPDDGSSRVAELVLAGSLVIVTQQKVVVERGQAVPAEDVPATLAHHLGAALVPFYGHPAVGASLDQAQVFAGEARQLVDGQLFPELVARLVGVPPFFALRTECELALCAVNGRRAAVSDAGYDAAYALAARSRTPGLMGIEFHVSIQLATRI